MRCAPRQLLLGCVGCRDPMLALIWYALLRGGGRGGEGSGPCRLCRRKLPRRIHRHGRSIVGRQRRRIPVSQASAACAVQPHHTGIRCRPKECTPEDVPPDMYTKTPKNVHKTRRYTATASTRLTSNAWHGVRALTSSRKCRFVSYMQYVRA